MLHKNSPLGFPKSPTPNGTFITLTITQLVTLLYNIPIKITSANKTIGYIPTSHPIAFYQMLITTKPLIAFTGLNLKRSLIGVKGQTQKGQAYLEIQLFPTQSHSLGYIVLHATKLYTNEYYSLFIKAS